jgi:L-aminopeptidase/D-esterase-like protein
VGKGISRDHAQTSGQGGAFRQFGPTKIAFFTNVNALGAIVNREGQVVRGNFNPKTQTHYHLWEAIAQRAYEERDPPGIGRNTTLSVLVTNEKMDFPALKQMARQVHTSMGRGIQPFQTLFDGDTLFALTTNEVENPQLRSIAGLGEYSDLGVIASEVAWDAILSCYP